MPFKKGEGGRPKGAKNKQTTAVRQTVLEFAKALMEDPEYLDYLRHRIKVGQIAPQIELYFLQLMGGKPKEQVELSGEVTLPVRVVHEYHGD